MGYSEQGYFREMLVLKKKKKVNSMKIELTRATPCSGTEIKVHRHERAAVIKGQETQEIRTLGGSFAV